GEARRRLAELESYEARAAELEQAREATRAQAVEAATELSRARQAGAGSLAEAVTPHLRELAMPAAAFEVVVEAGEPTDDGADRVVGEGRIRELSRMLAGVGESAHARSHAAELLDAGESFKRARAHGPA